LRQSPGSVATDRPRELPIGFAKSGDSEGAGVHFGRPSPEWRPRALVPLSSSTRSGERTKSLLVKETDPPRERDIRRHLVRHFRGALGVRVVEELVLLRGQSRVDIALISSRFDGFEIKSRQDSLARLPGQRAIYNRVFDRVTLVTSPHHLKRARRIIPSWWGIWTARSEFGALNIRELRGPGENPQVDIEAIVQLLWKDEIVALLSSLGGGASLKNRTRQDLCRRLICEVPHSELRRAVRETLGRRENWRSD
jgi:hypothetical protein